MAGGEEGPSASSLAALVVDGSKVRSERHSRAVIGMPVLRSGR